MGGKILPLGFAAGKNFTACCKKSLERGVVSSANIQRGWLVSSQHGVASSIISIWRLCPCRESDVRIARAQLQSRYGSSSEKSTYHNSPNGTI